jgi:hypothetical protein
MVAAIDEKGLTHKILSALFLYPLTHDKSRKQLTSLINGKTLTFIFLLKLSSQVTLDKSCLSSTPIADNDELESWAVIRGLLSWECL